MLEKEDLIKGATDDLLLQEAQSPTGSVPQFLVVSEIQRRKSMRDRFSAQEQQPEQSVAEQIVAGATPQGIGALQPEMPSQAPQMLPEMMAAQNAPMAPSPQMMAAGGGRMPYRRMAGGGMVPPNSLVEDASKFNPQTLYDMDASQMAMASPTNMGIASVLPMAAGGVVRMQNEGQVPFTSMYGPQYDLNNNEINELGIAPLDPNLSERDKRILQREERDKIRKQRQAEIIAENREKLSNFYNSLNFGERPESFKKRMELGNRETKEITNLDSIYNNFPGLDLSEAVLNDPDAPIIKNNLDKDQKNNEKPIKAKDLSILPAPEVPVLKNVNIGSKNISSFLNRDQGTELKTARELLREQLNQEVEPYDPTELLLKSQERSDKRALSEALIALGAGISRGDIASGFEGAGKSVAGIRNKQEALQQELEVRRGEAQTQSEKDKIARNIQIAQADISAIESNEGRQDKLLGRQLQYEGLLQDAIKNNNDASIKQFTADLAANKFVRSQFEFDETIAANLSEQEQLNYRQELATLNKAFEDVQTEIIKESKFADEDGNIPTWPQVQEKLNQARNSIFKQIRSLRGSKINTENPGPTKKERDYEAAGFTTN